MEATVGALVEIIHAFTMCELDNVNLAVKLYVGLLLSEVGDSLISLCLCGGGGHRAGHSYTVI